MVTETCELQVEVTEQDIEKGEKGRCTKCPIALAIGRTALTGQVTVAEDYVHWRHPERSSWWYRALTPSIANAFIVAFDEGRAVRPISFHLSGVLLEEGRAP